VEGINVSRACRTDEYHDQNIRAINLYRAGDALVLVLKCQHVDKILHNSHIDKRYQYDGQKRGYRTR
jgi:hypothetical protein